jgi:uncharacterized protein (TIGR03067 family)
MTRRIIGLLVVGTLTVIGVSRGDDTKRQNDQQAVQGTWKIIKGYEGGVEMPAKERDGIKLTFKGKKLVVSENGRDEEAEFELDASTSPRSINVQPPNEKKVFGIYEFDGDNLKLCFAREGGPRPTKFESPKDSKIGFVILQREKK